MKRTLTINISGTVFNIDEDAYEKLQAYLLDINRYFGSDPEGREIIMDIEARIAELFQEKTKTGGNVVTIQHVDEVIEVMGRPSDFAAEEEEDEEPTTQKKRTFHTGKRLYRDPEHQVLGGVCGGLGAYFNIDPVIFRLAFVLLFLISHGIIVLLYLIFWIVVPKASSTAQRLEMRGEDVNIDNIKKTIKDEFQDVKKNYQKFRNSPSYERGREKIDEAGSVLGSVLRVMLKVILIIIGLALIIGGLLTIIGLVGSLFISHAFLGIIPWGGHIIPHFFQFYVGTGTLNWLMISVAALVGIPLLALIYLGTKLVFRYKSNNAAVGLSAFALWIIALIILLGTGISKVNYFKRQGTYTQRREITTKRDTLYLKLSPDEYRDFIDENIHLDDMRIATLNGRDFLLGHPTFNIESTSANEPELIIRSKARGKTIDMAQDNAEDVNYKIVVTDSLVNLSPWFEIAEGKQWRDQEVHVTLRLPVGKTVYLDDKMIKIIYDIENTTNTWDGDMVGKFWTMTPQGLSLAK